MIREARADDRAALLALWVAAWRLAMPDIDFEARRPWFETHLDALQAAGARLIVVEQAGQPVGFVSVDPVLRHLDQLAVHPAHQGTGLASRLLEIAKALSTPGLSLEVNLDNRPARALYARHGFVERSSGINPRSGLPTLRLEWAPTTEA